MAKEVIIRVLGETEPSPSPTASSSGNTPKANAKEKKKEKTASEMVMTYAANRVWQAVKSEAQYHMGKYFNLTEDYKGQMMVDNAATTIDMAMSMYTSIKVGMVMGGPVGAAVAVAANALTKTTSALHRYADEATKIIDNAYGNYFYGTRAGFVAGGHGTEN